MDFQKKERYNLSDLRKIMEILRAPGGCPWDREQTHESIRSNMIEEAYEVIDAIDRCDQDGLREELGDVLMQVVFHARMEEEKGGFNFDDVVDGVCKKLVYRHPHVFGNVNASSTEQVLRNWDALKKAEKSQKTVTESMVSLPKGLPALIKSAKVQQKAARVGFDWPDVTGALEKVEEELSELKQAIAQNNPQACEEELGDLLFSAVNVSRFLHIDAEQSLSAAARKFVDRFRIVEILSREKGLKMEELSLTELDRLWDEAKKQ